MDGGTQQEALPRKWQNPFLAERQADDCFHSSAPHPRAVWLWENFPVCNNTYTSQNYFKNKMSYHICKYSINTNHYYIMKTTCSKDHDLL